MIQANELRIGNWVYDTRTIGDIAFVKNACVIKFIENKEYRYFDPIPLTPDILEKAGFVFRSISGLQFADYGNYVYNINTMKFFISEDGDNDKDFVIVKHLHQLQNLFFALCGEELKIKL